MPAAAATDDAAREKALADNRARQAKHRKKKQAEKAAAKSESVQAEVVDEKSARAQQHASEKIFAGAWNMLERGLSAVFGEEMLTSESEHREIVEAGGKLLESMSDNIKDSPGLVFALCFGSYAASRAPVVYRKFAGAPPPDDAPPPANEQEFNNNGA